MAGGSWLVPGSLLVARGPSLVTQDSEEGGMTRLTIIAAVLFGAAAMGAAAPEGPAPSGTCDRACLNGIADGYLADLAKALQRVFVYDGRYSAFRRRRHGRPPSGLSGHSFLGYLQTHDQIGNRAKGERSSHLMNGGRLKIAAALVLTAPFIPTLFQGEEWGATSPFLYFTDHDDPELARNVTEGRRREWRKTSAPQRVSEKTPGSGINSSGAE